MFLSFTQEGTFVFKLIVLHNRLNLLVCEESHSKAFLLIKSLCSSEV